MGIIKNYLSFCVYLKRKIKIVFDYELFGVRINGFLVVVGIRKGVGFKVQFYFIQGDY